MLKLTHRKTNKKNVSLPIKRVKAFSLIELMVTIAVLVIVTTIAIPSFTSLINSNRLTGQANELLAAVMLARAEAIKLNQSVVFCHSIDATNCSAPPQNGWEGWLVRGTLDVTPIASGIISSESLVVLSSNSISGAAINGIGSSLRFTAQGLLRNGNNPLNGVMRVCLPNSNVGNNIRDVEIRSGGRARVNSISAGQACPAPADPA